MNDSILAFELGKRNLPTIDGSTFLILLKSKDIPACIGGHSYLLMNEALAIDTFHLVLIASDTSKFWKIVCEGEKVGTRGCISSSAWYELSFEPSTTSVRFVSFS